jgi:hypothetical protein
MKSMTPRGITGLERVKDFSSYFKANVAARLHQLRPAGYSNLDGVLKWSLPLLRWLLDAGFSPRRPWPLRGRCVVKKVVLGQVFFSEYFSLSHVTIIPPMFPTHLPLILFLSEGRAGETWETSNKRIHCRISEGALH